MNKPKPFTIEKNLVVKAYELVKANGGAAGIDKQTIEDFGKDVKNNRYKLWNRLSSGSYFPPPVKAVPIPKKQGGERILGVPTVADRICQMVVRLVFEPTVEPHFLKDSYGYRPNKSALDAVGITRQRCWKYDWVLEYDIRGLFDNIPHDLLMKAVRCCATTISIPTLKVLRQRNFSWNLLKKLLLKLYPFKSMEAVNLWLILIRRVET